MNSQHNSRSFREAVVLNNLAASMMQHGAFEQAASTLKDCVSLVRSSVNATHSCSPAQQLHNARLRFSESLKQRKAPRESVDVEVLSNDAFSLIADQTTSGTSHFAIKIDNYDQTDKDANAISAILFYNFGLSYYCLSKTVFKSKSTSSKETMKYSKGALRLFRISQSLCAKVLGNKDSIECPELLNVMAVILEALTKFSLEANQVAQAKEFSSMLNQVRYVLKEATIRLGLCDGVASAAAA